ncbi:hypothetical protein IQ252_02155 [Tychonema sp. LEGE 07203]|nr:hypothetical protein [Tychonema sp. LEGE 07203]
MAKNRVFCVNTGFEALTLVKNPVSEGLQVARNRVFYVNTRADTQGKNPVSLVIVRFS